MLPLPAGAATRIAVAHLNFSLESDRLARSVDKIIACIHLASRNKAHLLICPEMILGGLAYTEKLFSFTKEESIWWRKSAVSQEYQNALQVIQAAAAKYNIQTIFGGCRSENDCLFNSLWLAGAEGLRVIRDKSREVPFFCNGEDFNQSLCVKIGEARVVPLICAEIGSLTQYIPAIKSAAANLVVVPLNWREPVRANEYRPLDDFARYASKIAGVAAFSNFWVPTRQSKTIIAVNSQVVGMCDAKHDAMLFADVLFQERTAEVYPPRAV